MRKIFFILTAILLLFALLIVNNNSKTKCKVFLMSKGYKLLSESDENYPAFLKSEYAQHISLKLNIGNISPICNEYDYDKLLRVQPYDMKKYIDKTIDIYIFAVSNHPLQEKIKDDGKPKSVLISVFMYKNKIIGGISVPLFQGEIKAGESFYSLEGNTLEEMIGNK